MRELPWSIPGGQQVQFTPFQIGGRYGRTAEVIGSGAIQSENFVSGSQGWRIDGQGNVEFEDGEFRGDITGATGTFDGTISADNVTAGTLTGSELSIGSGNNIFRVNSDGDLWIGHATQGSAPFQVDNQGNLVATTGTFSGTMSSATLEGTNALTNASTHRLRSGNYVAGTSGWSIDGDGDAEFNDILARGEIRTAASGQRMVLGSGGNALLEMYSGDGDEIDRGYINVDVNNAGASDFAFINLVAPSMTGGTRAYVDVSHYDNGTRQISLFADDVVTEDRLGVSGYITVTGNAGGTFAGRTYTENGNAGLPAYSFNDDTNSGMFRPSSDELGWSTGGTERMSLNSSGLVVGVGIVPEDDDKSFTAYPGTTLPYFYQNWQNYGGAYANARVWKDADGTVHMSGLIRRVTSASGAPNAICLIPAGYRPAKQEVNIVYSGAAGATRIDAYTNGQIVTNTNIIANDYVCLNGLCWRTD